MFAQKGVGAMTAGILFIPIFANTTGTNTYFMRYHPYSCRAVYAR
jgi:hypothetical protein